MDDRTSLEQAIALLEAQRPTLGAAVVDAALAPLRAQLASLDASPLRGERKFVTVMFADLAGFTALAETFDPEVARDLMNACYDCLVPIIQRYEGTVDKFMGDGLMVLFGAPVAHENDPERALRAALSMQAALRDFSAARGLDLALHFGINTGLVVAGGLGARDRQSYSVMGDAVNIAARLEAVSQRGEILVGPTTYRFTAPLFEFDALPHVTLKGKTEPVPVYRLRALKATRGSLRGLVGMRSPLVGRAAPYATLQHALSALQAGRGGVITVIGEAGLGKSRLIAEVCTSAPTDILWLEGRCLSFGASIAYWPWLDILRALAGVAPEAAPHELRDALRARLSESCGERGASIYPYVGHLLSLPLEAEAAATVRGLDGEALKSATFQAIELLCTCLSARQPVVIVGEDLHWADPTSLALFERLLPLTRSAPLLLIGVMRPERDHACWRFREQVERECAEEQVNITLEALDAEQSAELVAHLLRVEDLPLALRDKILRHAEGNPFYVEEIIRSLLDMQAIAYNEDTGAWRATRDVSSIELPDTLQGVLMARIDRLQQETKHILRLAAVIGRAFLYRVLAEITREERMLDARLGELIQGQLIRERAHEPELEYIFKHQLTQEAAYNGLLLKERRLYHQQVAEVIERLFPERSNEWAGLLAHHWEQAGDVERAWPALQRAGQLAAAQFANLEAIDYFTRALALIPAAQRSSKIELLFAREEVLDILGAREAQIQDLATLDGLLAELDAAGVPDFSLRAQLALRRAVYATFTSDFAAAVTASQLAIELAHRAGNVVHEVNALVQWGTALWRQGNLSAARDKCQQGLLLAQTIADRHLESHSLLILGTVLYYQGDYSAAQAHFEQVLTIGREIGDRRGVSSALNNLGEIARSQGDYARAREHYWQRLHIDREIGDRASEAVGLANLSLVAHTLGDQPAARQYAEQMLKVTREIHNQSHEAYAWNNLGHALVALGEVDAGIAAYHKAIALRRALHEHFMVMESLAGLARAYLARHALAEALVAVEEILIYLQDNSLDGTDEPFRVYLTCVEVLTAADDSRADTVLDSAHTLLQTQAARIPDARARQAFLEYVAENRALVATWQVRGAA